MSIQRLDILVDNLANRGWEAINLYSNYLYHVADDDFMMYWEVKRKSDNQSITIEFIFMDDIYYSKNLNDVSWCIEYKNNTRLDFQKINSLEWRSDLKEWVDNLGK